MSESTTDRGPTSTTYRCVVGHEIPPADLDRLTDLVMLDAGARVRICREHGAPIAETKLGTGSASG